MQIASKMKSRLNVKSLPRLAGKLERLTSYNISCGYKIFNITRRVKNDVSLIRGAASEGGKDLKVLVDNAISAKSPEEKWRILLPLVITHVESSLGLIAHKPQVESSLLMLSGIIVEVETGEGKTLSIAMGAACRALLGEKVHIITANDYLAERDAKEMQHLYQSLGLSVSYVVGGTGDASRLECYEADIIYTTQKEVAADFLRDVIRIKATGLTRYALYLDHLTSLKSGKEKAIVQSERHSIFVDEADNCLIDEAITPLIITQEKENLGQEQLLNKIWEISNEIPEALFKIVAESKKCIIIGDLRKFLSENFPDFIQKDETGPIKDIIKLIITAIEARLTYTKKVDYDVVNGKVAIIDVSSGRLMHNRSWSKGLHQFIELKEGVDLSKETNTQAKITFQDYFRMYTNIGGASGTVREVQEELWFLYKTPVVKVSRQKSCKRVQGEVFFERSDEDQKQRLLDLVRAKIDNNKAVLLGCDSVVKSIELNKLLALNEITSSLLNAESEENEYAIIAQAGKSRTVTVGTQMVGRGTDIKLDSQALAGGGLSTILISPNKNVRIDRQFFGRSARQDDPGEQVEIYSLSHNTFKDSLFVRLIVKPPVFIIVNKSKVLRSIAHFVFYSLVRSKQRRYMKKSKEARAALQSRDFDSQTRLSYLRSRNY